MLPGDLEYLSENLRGADVRELMSASGSPNTLSSLRVSLKHSVISGVGAEEGSAPFFLWGVSRPMGSSALIWAVGTPEVRKAKIAFLRASRKNIKAVFSALPGVSTLFNFSHSSNTVHHEWLRWCGANLFPPVPHGAFGEDFIPFAIERHRDV